MCCLGTHQCEDKGASTVWVKSEKTNEFRSVKILMGMFNVNLSDRKVPINEIHYKWQ